MKRAYLIIIIACLLVVFSTINAFPQSIVGTEYEVKAAFLYNVAKFVEWPHDSFNDEEDLLILCVQSNNPETDVFSSLNNKKVAGRKIMVIKCEDTEQIEKCHILFIDSKERSFIKKSLKSVKDMSILTVGHYRDFEYEGGIINFFTEQGRLRFEVNLEAAKRVGLKLGSQLLMSAEIFNQGKK